MFFLEPDTTWGLRVEGMKKKPLYSVGEVATMLGLTVRQLHHWDELGVVSARPLPPHKLSSSYKTGGCDSGTGVTPTCFNCLALARGIYRGAPGLKVISRLPRALRRFRRDA
ncbi:MerR family DNA-binding transcriptional regulator [Dermabacteraceae bacterium P13264]